MIDYERLNDREYFNRTISDINTISDERELADLLKGLSVKLFYKEIDPIQANMLLGQIKNRIAILSGGKRSGGGGNTNSNSQDKMIRFSPTSVSNHHGSASIVFLVVNIAIITVMYTLLILGKIIG